MTDGIFSIHIMFLIGGFLFISAVPFLYFTRKFIIKDQHFSYWNSYSLLLLIFITHQFVFRGITEFNLATNNQDSFAYLVGLGSYLWPLLVTFVFLFFLVGQMVRTTYHINSYRVFALLLSGTIITLIIGAIVAYILIYIILQANPLLLL